jgi:Protein of unknown function (DUF1682)
VRHLVPKYHTLVNTFVRYTAHEHIFEAQFSKPTNGGITQDGYSDFFNFSTGRRAVASLHTVFTLRPRHDLAQLVFQIFYGLYDLNYRPSDDVTLTFKLHNSSAAPSCIWAVVNKSELKDIKKDRWDLVRSLRVPARSKINTGLDIY